MVTNSFLQNVFICYVAFRATPMLVGRGEFESLRIKESLLWFFEFQTAAFFILLISLFWYVFSKRLDGLSLSLLLIALSVTFSLYEFTDLLH